MNRALIIDEEHIIELYGKHYIPFSDWNQTIPDYKALKNEVIKISDVFDEEYTAFIFIEPEVSYIYQEQLRIANNGEIAISTFKAGEVIEFDSENNLLTNESERVVFKNFKICNEKYIDYRVGDTFHIGTLVSITIKAKYEYEVVIYDDSFVRMRVALLTGLRQTYKDFPLYTNSPKLNYSIPETKVDLRAPKETEKKNSVKDVIKKLIPTMVTFTLTIILIYFKPRGPYIIISLTSTIISSIIMVFSFIDDRRENKQFNLKRKKIYEDNLHDVTTELTKLKTNEESILKYLYPTSLDIIDQIANNSTRLYERDGSDEDFLKLNIGLTSAEPTYQLTNPVDELKIDKEQLELRVQAIYNKFKKLNNTPKVIDMNRDNVGLVGPKSIINKHVSDLLLQLIFFHSYHDLKIIPIINKHERGYIDKFTRAKHFQFDDGMYTIIDSELTRDAILASIVQVLRSRTTNEGEEATFPIFFFVISNFDLIANHPIMEFLNNSSPSLGYRMLFISERQENLISNLQTIAHIKNSHQAKIVIENKVISNDKFRLNQPTNEPDASLAIKKVGQLEHIKGVKSSLPDKLTFLDMYNVERVSDLEIKSRWTNSDTEKTLKALIGKKSQVDDVYLDLHEKAHGPHGLIAGTTGSGKSEVIQTYILSLAINYSPEYVGFLLIDYKGGGMANLFTDMPHMLGSITNLDGYLAMRAMESIKGELKRRQSLFSKYNVNHINGYHKLYKKNKGLEPLPHLFLISDEFAELKSNEPEFMKELVSAARIGRSLGIHLILATQKPSGVVDDQIWSNSKFKLCLKVAEPADSRELLKTTDAAYIKEPGRGYLKVGTNELYELFQSGYSGALYNKGDVTTKDESVYLIDKYGRENLLNPIAKSKEVNEPDSELTVVLEQISLVYNNADYAPVTKPWLPPLADNIAQVIEYKPLDDRRLSLHAEIGMIDIPSKQSQISLDVDLLQNANIGIFGSVQSGKTTTMQTILLALASNNSPKNLCYYILDYGNGRLVSMSGLKHTADYLTIEDTDKFDKLIKLLKKEIKLRKQKLSRAMASNFAGYNQVEKEPLQAIVIALDNYDVLRDMGEMAEQLNFLFRSGASLGIFIIVTANKLTTLRIPHQPAITQAIQHYTADRSELTNSLGARSDYEMKQIAGRVQVKVESPEVAQVNLPVASADEKSFINNLKQTIEKINDQTTSQNIPLPVMPKQVEFKPEYQQQDKIFLGLDYEDIEPQYIVIQDMAIAGGNGFARANLLGNILKQIKQSVELVIDDNSMNLYEMFNDTDVYYTKNDIDQVNDKLEGLIDARQSAYNQYVEANGFLVPKFYFDMQSKAVVVIRGLRTLNELDMTSKNKLLTNLKRIRDLGVDMIVDTEDSKGMDEVTKLTKTFSDFILLCATNEQQLKPLPRITQCSKDNIIHIDSGEIKLIKKEGI